jgi:ribosome-binding protein aMBF1 (putative translation factor)
MTSIPRPLSKSKDTVTLSRKDWNAILDALEEAQDLRTIDESRARRSRGEDDGLPIELVERLFRGESPVRIWREARGLSVNALAKKAGVSQPYLSEIENRVKPGSVAALKKLATALKLDVDDLVTDWAKRPLR